MKSVPHIIVTPPDAADARPHVASWYTPGLSDGLGDRLLMFDNTAASSLELLRFKREFSDAPAFEAALRRRVADLEHFQHPSMARVRAVEWLEAGEGLALVSDHATGRRLSEALQEARGPAFALALIRQLVPVLAAFQRQAGGIAHGALTAERIVVTPEGRLVIVEHVLGSALEALKLPIERLQTELGLAVSADCVLDRRGDVIQLAFVALSLLVGRRVNAAGYPGNAAALLRESIAATVRHGNEVPARLQLWLERALQLGARAFASAEDALYELPVESELAGAELPRTLLPFHPAAPSGPSVLVRPSAETPSPAPVVEMPDYPLSASNFVPERPAGVVEVVEILDQPEIAEVVVFVNEPQPEPEPQSEDESASLSVFDWTEPSSDSEAPAPPSSMEFLPAAPPFTPAAESSAASASPKSRFFVPARRTAAAFAVLALGEAFVIAGLVYTRPAARPLIVETPRPPVDAARLDAVPPPAAGMAVAPAGSPAPVAAPSTSSREVAAAAPQAETPRTPEASGPSTPTTPLAGRVGGLRVTSPIDLQVSENGKALGSTSSPIALTEGRHTIDLSSDAIGYHTREIVTVKPGQLASLTITPPNGHLSINALPWAEVLIDGKSAGETPIGNMLVPVGSHQVVFRHPQLGEQWQTVIVRADGLTRISANLQR